MTKKRPARSSEPAPKIPEASATDLPVHVHVPTQTGLGITMFLLGIDAPPAWERSAIAELSRHEYYRNEFGAMGIPLPSTKTEWAALIGRIGDPKLLLAFARDEVTPAELLVQFANLPKTEPAGQPFMLPAFPHVAAPSTATSAKAEAADKSTHTLHRLCASLAAENGGKPWGQLSEAERLSLLNSFAERAHQATIHPDFAGTPQDQYIGKIEDWLESLGLPRDIRLAAQVALADTYGEFATSADIDDFPMDNLIELFRIDTASKASAQRLAERKKLEGEVLAGARVEPLKQPKTRRSTRRCEDRDRQFIAWSQGGLSAKEIASKWNANQTDDVSEVNVRQILSRSNV